MTSNNGNATMARRKAYRLIILFLITAILLLPRPTQANAAESKDLTLTIIHTNDLHAHEEPFRENKKMVGGWAGVGHVIRQLKKEHPDALVLDAGDIFQGSILYTKYHGAVEVHLLNQIGYDAFTIGNHEFDDGPHNLADQLSKARFDIVSANLDAAAAPKLAALCKPYIIKKVDDEPVAIIGAITPELESLCNHRDGVKLKVKGELWWEPIKSVVDKLTAEGYKRIIVLSHCGVQSEKELAEKIPAIDAIIGGHSHTRLDRPLIVKHEDGTTTTIVQTGAYGRAVGLLQLAFDGNGVVNSDRTTYKLFDVNQRTPKDQDLKSYIDEQAAPFAAMTKTIIGKASANFEKRNTLSDSSMGNLVCDAIAETGRDYGVTISFQNRGGIRGLIEEGPITLAEINQILPFDNFVTFATVNGAIIRRVIEHSLADGMGGHFFEVHGLKIAYDKTRPTGNRIVFALAQDENGHYKPLDDNRQYKMAVNDYSFGGGESYDFAGSTDVVKTEIRISEAMTRYIKKHNEISPRQHDRIVCVREGLLSITADDGVKTLHLKGGPKQARVTLVAGTGIGVSTVFNAMPVPLEDARILKTGLEADAEGNFQVNLKELLKSYKPSEKKATDAKILLCAIAYPVKGSSENTAVTSAIEVGATH